ncbi:MAG: pseudouridine synthase [Candidatus Bipolaricaulota bacterium]|nr:pseudouridine synthase [Candidatus Bipolaricaulota bacterium]
MDERPRLSQKKKGERSPPPRGRVSLARALSKLGYSSRKAAEELVRDGRVSLDGRLERDPSTRLDLERGRIEVDGRRVLALPKVHLLLNKPRGLVTTTSDEKGRDTVYRCLADSHLPWVSSVGRLDKASEGLLLFTNDTRWAAAILAPENHVEKTYHVQIGRAADDDLVKRIQGGVATDEDERLAARRVRLLRRGTKTSWLEVVLDEGKNREIRRLLDTLGVEVLRLVRVAIGPLALGTLPKGAWRHLSEGETRALVHPGKGTAQPAPCLPQDSGPPRP